MVGKDNPPATAIAKELANRLFASVMPPVANFGVALIMTVGWLYERPSWLALWWTAANAFLCAARVWLFRAYWRQPRAGIEPELWMRRNAWLTLPTGLLWGGLAIAAGWAPTAASPLVIPFAIVAISASIASTHTADLASVRAFIYPACLLMVASMALSGDTAHVVVGVLTLVFIINIELVSRRTHAALTQTLVAEREQARSREHLVRAQQVAATGSAELDVATDTIVWSDEMYRLIGREPGTWRLTEDNILDVIHEDDRPIIKTARRLSRQGQPVPPGELRIVRPDGQVRTLYVETDLQCDQAGVPARLLTICKDVTDLRAAQQREQDTEQKLVQSQKIEALGTLAGGVAHEINNALVPTIALTKLVARKLAEDSSERRNLAAALSGAERARDLVKQILSFTRRQSVSSEKGPLDLTAVTHSAVMMMRASLPTTIAISEQVAAVPAVLGDANQLTQVIVNLMSNAAQAVGDRIGSIAVSLAIDEDDGMASLAITDSGCGMDEATRARIFEPFFTTKEVGQGTGLGLSIVHAIIEGHGGQIAVASRPGEGSCFSIRLPLAAAALRRSA